MGYAVLDAHIFPAFEQRIRQRPCVPTDCCNARTWMRADGAIPTEHRQSMK